MTQIRVPADVAKTDKSNTWTGTQDFTAATVLGVAGGPGGTVSGATAAAAGVVQLAGDLSGTYQAPTVPGLTAKADKAALAAVATTGAYGDLSGRPALAPVATTGAYADLTGRPALAAVATTGAYGDLTGKPATVGGILSAVSYSGSFAGTANTSLAQVQLTTVALDPARAYTYDLGAINVGTVASVSVRALAGATAPTSASGTLLAVSRCVANGGQTAPVRATFSVGTAGVYTFAAFIDAATTQSTAGLPIAATVTDVGPKITGLPAVP